MVCHLLGESAVVHYGLDQPLKTFWMDKAYRIPDNPDANEEPQHLSPVTVPINRMSVHSIFVRPEPDEQFRVGLSTNWRESPTTAVMGYDASRCRKMADKLGATRPSAQTWESTPGEDGKRSGRLRRKARIA